MSEIVTECSPARVLVAAPSRTFSARRFLLWINVLGLDAPLVAFVWQDFFAACFRIKIAVVPRIILVSSVWLAYSADRWLDGWRIPQGQTVTERHRFAQRHRGPLACVWIIVLFASVALSWQWLPACFFERGLYLVGAVSVYLFLNQCTRWLRGLKEIAVGILFAAGTIVFILPQHETLRDVWWPMVNWGLLCSLNCYGIACWEHNEDRAQKQESLVTRWPRLAGHFKMTALSLAIFTLVPAVLWPASGVARIGMAIASSAIILTLLDNWNHFMDTGVLRVAADLVLLTPLFFRFL